MYACGRIYEKAAISHSCNVHAVVYVCVFSSQTWSTVLLRHGQQANRCRFQCFAITAVFFFKFQQLLCLLLGETFAVFTPVLFYSVQNFKILTFVNSVAFSIRNNRRKLNIRFNTDQEKQSIVRLKRLIR